MTRNARSLNELERERALRKPPDPASTVTTMKLKTSLCIALALFGLTVCAAPANAQGINLNTSLQTEIIHDPLLGGIKAFTVTMPSGWHFQGAVIAAGECGPPSPVFRGYSPDGLTEIRLLPFFNWQVMSSKNSHFVGPLSMLSECIFLHSTMTAAQFLDSYVKTLGSANIVGPMSISAQYRRQLDELVAKMNAMPPQDPKSSMHTTGDAAALRIETTNGTFIIEQRLRARVVCSLWSKAITDNAGHCIARLDVLRAPKGQLDALVILVDSHDLTNAKNDDEWLSRIVAQMKDQRIHFDPSHPHPNKAVLAIVHRQARDFGLATREEVERELEELGEPVGRTFRTMAEIFRPRDGTDWADFALDPDPDTMHTWSSSSGERYQTYDPGANPNGVLAGNWTQIQQGNVASGIPH